MIFSLSLYSVLKLLHLLAVIAWVGGMFFAHFCLRPAAQAVLQPPQRVPLMHGALQRFFAVATVASLGALFTGLALVWQARALAVEVAGSSFKMPLGWTLMATLGLLMVAIFGHIRLALYPRLQRAVAASDWPAGGQALGSIRQWVALNLALGGLIVVITQLVRG
jgi:uncharacterized membrane protein